MTKGLDSPRERAFLPKKAELSQGDAFWTAGEYPSDCRICIAERYRIGESNEDPRKRFVSVGLFFYSSLWGEIGEKMIFPIIGSSSVGEDELL